ncbi:hypothetical protein Dimus_028521, partial [Dionaea muscipula]
MESRDYGSVARVATCSTVVAARCCDDCGRCGSVRESAVAAAASDGIVAAQVFSGLARECSGVA